MSNWRVSRFGASQLPEAPVAVGDRVRVTGVMRDEPNPLPVGSEGTVTWVNTWTCELTEQFSVNWDNGRRLMLLGCDPYEITERYR